MERLRSVRRPEKLSRSTKAALLATLNQPTEAGEGSPADGFDERLHQYARTVLAQKRAKEAYVVFKLHFDKNSNQFTTNVGMARGLSAIGEYKTP